MIDFTKSLIIELKKSKAGKKLLEIISDSNLTKKQKIIIFQQWLKEQKQVAGSKAHQTN